MALPKVNSSLKERLEGVPGAEVVVGGDGDVDLVAVVVPEKGDLQRVGLVGALWDDINVTSDRNNLGFCPSLTAFDTGGTNG